jgi:phenylalanyl-tRNA synthetase beta chain
LKGVVELLFARLGEPAPRWELQAETPAFLHPGRASRLAEGGQTLGYAGVVHPDVRERLELKDEAVVLELDMERLLESSPERTRFRVLDRYPAVERDLSVLCDEATPAAEIDARVRGAAGQRLRSVSLVDRYTGNQVPPGKVSLTVSLRFQDSQRTLTNEEVQQAMDDVIRELRATGLEIRGE